MTFDSMHPIQYVPPTTLTTEGRVQGEMLANILEDSLLPADELHRQLNFSRREFPFLEFHRITIQEVNSQDLVPRKTRLPVVISFPTPRIYISRYTEETYA